MMKYICGMIMGFIFMFFCFLLWILINKKKFIFSKKGIYKNIQKQISNDIKMWSENTNNVFIPSSLFKLNNNNLFQIDSILLTNKSLIVIQINDLEGTILGDANANEFEFFTESKKYLINNPIIKNKKNINNILKIMNCSIPTISLIIYSNKIKEIDIKEKPEYVVITRHDKLLKNLDNIDNILDISITQKEIEYVYKKLKTHITTKKKDFKKIS